MNVNCNALDVEPAVAIQSILTSVCEGLHRHGIIEEESSRESFNPTRGEKQQIRWCLQVLE